MAEGIGEVLAGLGEIGFDLHRPAKTGDGLDDLAGLLQRGAEVVMFIGIVGLEFDGSAEMEDSLVESMLPQQGDAEVECGPLDSRA